MTDCEKYQPLLFDFSDGTLDDAQQQELSAHLAACAACRERLAELAQIHEAFFAMDEVEAPEGFAQGVMDRVRAEKRGARHHSRYAGLAACAAVVLFTAGVFLPYMLGMGKGAAPADAAPEACAAAEECAEAPVAADEQMSGASGAPSRALTMNNGGMKFAVTNDADERAAAEYAAEKYELCAITKAKRRDYLIENAADISYAPDGTVESYTLPIEYEDELIELCAEDGAEYELSETEDAERLLVRYTGGAEND